MEAAMRFSGGCASRPRKMRLVVDLIRGKDVNEAYAILKFNKKLAAKQIAKTLKSAVANAEQKALKDNEAFDVDTLFVTKAIVNVGQPLKRFTRRRAGPRRRRSASAPATWRSTWPARRASNGSEDASDRAPARHRQAVVVALVRRPRTCRRCSRKTS